LEALQNRIDVGSFDPSRAGKYPAFHLSDPFRSTAVKAAGAESRRGLSRTLGEPLLLTARLGSLHDHSRTCHAAGFVLGLCGRPGTVSYSILFRRVRVRWFQIL
jgi:hypothetical protein